MFNWNFDPLAFPLFCLRGEKGFHLGMKLVRPDGNEGKNISQRMFYCYLLAYRRDSILYCNRTLLQQLIVMAWSHTVSSILNRHRNGKKYFVPIYFGVLQTIYKDPMMTRIWHLRDVRFYWPHLLFKVQGI